jgi:hypothetical protein
VKRSSYNFAVVATGDALGADKALRTQKRCDSLCFATFGHFAGSASPAGYLDRVYPEHLSCQSCARDPLRSLVFHAVDRAVRDVWIDGQHVVDRGRVVTLDGAGALEWLAAARARMEATVPQRDPRGRTSAEITPLSLPITS